MNTPRLFALDSSKIREYRPSNSLESKALYLEETLEKMQGLSDSLYKKIKRLKKTKPSDPQISVLEEKLKSVNQGITEVFQKCNIIWNDIKTQATNSGGLR